MLDDGDAHWTTRQEAALPLFFSQDLQENGWSFCVTGKRWISLLCVTFLARCLIPEDGHNIEELCVGFSQAVDLFPTTQRGFHIRGGWGWFVNFMAIMAIWNSFRVHSGLISFVFCCQGTWHRLEMSDFHNRSQTSARRSDYVWQYEYYDDEEPVSFEGLKAHRCKMCL